MTSALGSWRATYTPGDWVVLSGPTSLVMLEPPAADWAGLVPTLWEDVLASASLTDLASRLAAHDLDAVRSFAAFFWTADGMRSLVRGNITVVDLATGAAVANGTGMQTWSEVGLADVTRVRVDVGGSRAGRPADVDQGDTDQAEVDQANGGQANVGQAHGGEAGESALVELPLVVGAVRAGSVVLDADERARVRSPQAPFASAGSTPRAWAASATAEAVAAGLEPHLSEGSAGLSASVAADVGPQERAAHGGDTADGDVPGEAAGEAAGEAVPREAEDQAPPEASERPAAEEASEQPAADEASEQPAPDEASEQAAADWVAEGGAQQPATAAETPAGPSEVQWGVWGSEPIETPPPTAGDLAAPSSAAGDLTPPGVEDPDLSATGPMPYPVVTPTESHPDGAGSADAPHAGSQRSAGSAPISPWPAGPAATSPWSAGPAATSPWSASPWSAGPASASPASASPASASPASASPASAGSGPGSASAGSASAGSGPAGSGAPDLDDIESGDTQLMANPFLPQGTYGADEGDGPPTEAYSEPLPPREPEPQPYSSAPYSPAPYSPAPYSPAPYSPAPPPQPYSSAPQPTPGSAESPLDATAPMPALPALPAAAQFSGPVPPAAPPTDASVAAVVCPRGHLNPPNARNCRVCGSAILPQGSRLVPRPLLAVLRASDGTTAPVDRTVLIGRAPSADRASARSPRLMTVPSPGHDISRTHLEVNPVGWQIAVTDLRSTNGTVLVRPGGVDRQDLPPGEPVTVQLGSVLELGDGISVLIDLPQ